MGANTLDLSKIDAFIVDQKKEIARLDEEIKRSPHIVPENERARGLLTTTYLRFVGQNPQFVRKEDAKSHLRDVFFLALPVGITTYGIGSYLGFFKFLAAAGITSVGIQMALAGIATVGTTAAFIYMLDSSILKDIKNWGISRYEEGRKLAQEFRDDAKSVASGVKNAPNVAQKTESLMKGAKFLTMHNVPIIGRFALSSLFAVVTTAKILDASLYSNDVDSIVIARHEAEQLELEQGLGMSNNEIIAEKRALLEEARTELGARKSELKTLEASLAGNIEVTLTPAEQAQISSLQSRIADLQRDLETQRGIRDTQFARMTSEENLGTEASANKAGRGPEWRDAKQKYDYAQSQISRIEREISSSLSRIEQINTSARESALAAAAARNELVQAGRESDLAQARLRVRQAEERVSQLEDYRALAATDPRFRALDMNEGRFSALFEALAKSGDSADYIMGAGIAAGIIMLETSYILNKIGQKIPHDSDLRAHYHAMFVAEKNAQKAAAQEQIDHFDRMKRQILAIEPNEAGKSAKLSEEARATERQDAAEQEYGAALLRSQGRRDAQARALEAQSLLSQKISAALKTGSFDGLSDGERREIEALLRSARANIIQAEKTLTLNEEGRVLSEQAAAMEANARGIQARMEAARKLIAARNEQKHLFAQLQEDSANDDRLIDDGGQHTPRLERS